jgi:hypothetical protein
MSYSSSPILDGRIRDWLKLSAEDRADYLDPRPEQRREQEKIVWSPARCEPS